jgi:hypothetical protein
MSGRIEGTFKTWFDTTYKGIFDNQTMSDLTLVRKWLATKPTYPHSPPKPT